jgi:NAD(P)H dehydrogenase (quinone)
MGGVSAPFKAFMDASSKTWYERKWADKVAAGFTNSASQSGDKLATLIQLAIFAAQHGMHWVSLNLLPGNNNSNGSVEDLNRLGSFLGAMAQSNADQGPEAGPISSDLRTAELLGARVATIAAQLVRGRT